MVAPIDHLATARARLLSQWRGKPRIDLVLQLLFGDQAGALQQGFRFLEELAFNLLEDRSLATAAGAQLDGIGELVGQARAGGEADAVYRMKLAAAMLRNKSDGDAETLRAIVAAIIGAKYAAAKVTDTPPAAFVIHILATGALTADEGAAIVAFVLAAKAAGVGVNGITWAAGNVFGWAEDPDPNVHGFDVGEFAGVFFP